MKKVGLMVLMLVVGVSGLGTHPEIHAETRSQSSVSAGQAGLFSLEAVARHLKGLGWPRIVAAGPAL
jgi:hypothetical protein